jgi:thiamine biosynthesis lipoprotein
MLSTDGAQLQSQGGKPGAYTLSHRAMATTWQLLCFGDDRADCEHAAELAFEEIDAIEEQLSFFLPESDIGQLNQTAVQQPVRVSLETLECLTLARQVYALTGGAFDPTVGALLTGRRSWQESETAPPDGVPPESPQPERLGFETIEIDEPGMAVARTSERVQLDLGAIGKGFAVDRALGVLDDWLEGSAMLIAGQSTMRGLVGQGRADQWLMQLRDPRDGQTPLDAISLGAQAISAAAPGPNGHVLDPRTGRSVAAVHGAWAVAESGALSDALATAALVMSGEQLADCCQKQAGIGLARLSDAGFEVYGQWASEGGTMVGGTGKE